MMCEPLRGKTKDWIANGRQHTIEKIKNDVKSAVEGLIKYHENEIERIIEMVYYTNMERAVAMVRLHIHYESIQVIEHWSGV